MWLPQLHCRFLLRLFDRRRMGKPSRSRVSHKHEIIGANPIPATMNQHDVEKTLNENAATSQSIQTKDGAATAHSIPDQIQWANRVAWIAARRAGRPGFSVIPIRGSDPIHG
jgi:hypothetical protein